jgi:hypothetical protein
MPITSSQQSSRDSRRSSIDERLALSVRSLSHSTADENKMGLAEIVSPTSSSNIGSPFMDNQEENFSPSSALPPSYSSSSKKHIIHQKHKVTPPTSAQLAKTSSNGSPPTKTLPMLPSKPIICSCSSLHGQQVECINQIVPRSVAELWQHLYSFESLKTDFCHKLWTKLGYTG